MADPATHDARSQALADEIRRFLVGIHTGGIATTVALAASLANGKVQPRWALWPIAIFVAGIVLAAVSMFLAQHREFRRRDAAERNEAAPAFKKYYWSWRWSLASLVFFVLGVGVCLYSLATVA